MKTLGLIGGMSWESTVSYYQMINRGVNAKLGGFHSAKLLLSSVDFAVIEQLQRAGDWNQMAELLNNEAQVLSQAGADAIVICTNTMHKVADDVVKDLSIPLLHIADATGTSLAANKVKKVGLLGTQFTMEQTFYTERLKSRFGIEVVVPSKHEREIVHRIIYEQLCKGVICTQSRSAYIEIIDNLASVGAEGVILGCTEIALLVQQLHTNVQLYDTTALHAAAAVDFATG
ncbi:MULTISPECIES: aspartate/glutamate racemase family protein [Alteromonas]|jgi:aspartate racemase|uniref:Amino acid racemase n=1 Tax=Alteromonas hispanica TaxID=315421 RepID=A0A6L9MT42_9ALTE|nr:MULTISPECIES: aspartate/glutamate racemase family protein [Alteromonas]APE07368.1 aspartate racemase [Alteromonas sp. RW2A1]AUC89996.1 aspartate/glutamate racemase family protein [Alteromonas sp. MB-3u-76]MAI63987.1 aspartate/glutamate racemase family protein [Alteromonas sp.]NDW21326.1 amino acid racemase [Alteromonas hispanica]